MQERSLSPSGYDIAEFSQSIHSVQAKDIQKSI